MIQRNFKHIIPREIDSEVRFNKFLSATDLIVGFLLFSVLIQFQSMVHPMLSLPYLVFIGLLILFLLLPAGNNNAGKKTYHVLLYLILKPHQVYHSIDREELT